MIGTAGLGRRTSVGLLADRTLCEQLAQSLELARASLLGRGNLLGDSCPLSKRSRCGLGTAHHSLQLGCVLLGGDLPGLEGTTQKRDVSGYLLLGRTRGSTRRREAAEERPSSRGLLAEVLKLAINLRQPLGHAVGIGRELHAKSDHRCHYSPAKSRANCSKASCICNSCCGAFTTGTKSSAFGVLPRGQYGASAALATRPVCRHVSGSGWKCRWIAIHSANSLLSIS